MAMLYFELAFILMSAIVSLSSVHSYDYTDTKWNSDETSVDQLDCQPCTCEKNYYYLKCETKDTIEQISNIALPDNFEENKIQSM